MHRRDDKSVKHFTRKPERGHKRSEEDNIKLYLKEIVLEEIEWIHLA
jgi:hypothetical protein